VNLLRGADIDAANDDDPLGGERLSNVRQITSRARLANQCDAAEAIDKILPELEKLFQYLQVYMNERNYLIMRLSSELNSLIGRRNNLRRIVSSATFTVPVLKIQYVTTKGKSSQPQLDVTESAVELCERQLGLLKMPVSCHIKRIDDFKQFDSLVPTLTAMATIMQVIDQYVGYAQADFDRSNTGQVPAVRKKIVSPMPLQEFRKNIRRVNSLEQVWNAAYLRSVMADYEPDCRTRIPEEMPLWDMFRAWCEPWDQINQ
jgi:hypothetical protein